MAPLSSREIINMLKRDGWYLVRTRGSHHQLKHPSKKGVVTVPHPRKELDPKTVRSILGQAGIKQIE